MFLHSRNAKNRKGAGANIRIQKSPAENSPNFHDLIGSEFAFSKVPTKIEKKGHRYFRITSFPFRSKTRRRCGATSPPPKKPTDAISPIPTPASRFANKP